jgi:hypothetical protein
LGALVYSALTPFNSRVNPSVAANQAAIEELFDRLTALLRELDADAVNWHPPIPDTNTIAAMTSHVVGSTDRWLRHAAGEPRRGDREAELRATATPEELTALIAGARLETSQWFERIAEIDPSTIRPDRLHPGSPGVTVAWCVQHALIHAGEHWGQIQLTRQMNQASGMK